MARIPNLPMADVLIHGKPSERDEVIVFPITRYQNVVGAPALVTPNTIKTSAPFQMVVTDTVDLPAATIRQMCGNII